jgi:hypothetical protein
MRRMERTCTRRRPALTTPTHATPHREADGDPTRHKGTIDRLDGGRGRPIPLRGVVVWTNEGDWCKWWYHWCGEVMKGVREIRKD